MHLFKIGFSVLLAALFLAACGGGKGGGGPPAPDTTVSVSFGFPANPSVPLAPIGTVGQITSLTLDVVETDVGTVFATAQVVDISGGLTGATATVQVPKNTALTLTGHAFNAEVIPVEIFTGTASGNSGTSGVSVPVPMTVVDNGVDISPPTMTLSCVGCTELVPDALATVTVSITGTASVDVLVTGIGTEWTPAGPQTVSLDIDGAGSIDLTWTAPADSGGSVVGGSILLESGTMGTADYTALETDVLFTVAVAPTVPGTGTFQFGPVIIGLSGKNTGADSATNNNPSGGTDLSLTVTTEAGSTIDLDASLTQGATAWTNTVTSLAVADTGGTVTMPGYDAAIIGTLDVTATDLNSLTTTNRYALAAGQYPAPQPLGGTPIGSGPAAVDLGSASNYVILASSAISTVPASVVTGDMGLSPAAASFITGFSLILDGTGVFSTSTQVIGNVYAADYAVPTPATLTTAVLDMQAAYTDAAGRITPDVLDLGSGDIGGLVLTPGLYKWNSTVSIPANVTFSGGANDVWILQSTGLTMAGAMNVILDGGAQAKNIFWQVAGSTSIGAGAHFEGIILCSTDVTLVTGASMNGRILAQTAVALQSATVTQP